MIRCSGRPGRILPHILRFVTQVNVHTIKRTVYPPSTYAAAPQEIVRSGTGRLRVKHYSHHTEEAYVQWVCRYILFHHKRHLIEMSKAEIKAFLTDFAVKGQVAASTQNQELSALLFLYHVVLDIEVVGVDVVRAKRP